MNLLIFFRITCLLIEGTSNGLCLQIVAGRLLSHVWLFVTPGTSRCQASLSFTNSWSLLKLMSVKSVMPSNHLIPCCPLFLQPSIFPSIRVFQMSQLFTSRGQSIGASASTSVLPMNTQDWSPLGWTSWISLQSKGLSRVFNTTVQKHQFFGNLHFHFGKWSHWVMSDSLRPRGL